MILASSALLPERDLPVLLAGLGLESHTTWREFLRRNDDVTALIIGAVVYFGVFRLLADIAGNWAWVVAGLIPAVPVAWQYGRRWSRRCPHGVRVGCYPDRCETCVGERSAQQLAREEEHRLDQARRRAERQTAYAEWATRLRVPEYLRSMDPIEFEKLVADLYSRHGYSATLTPTSGDGGVDVRLQKDGLSYLVQCKRVRGSVGEPTLRDLYGVVVAEGATEGWIVTTGRPTTPAREWTRGKPLRFVELDELQRLLEDTYPPGSVVPDGFVVPAEAVPVCPDCGARLRRRRGRYGVFLGCSGYPSCNYTRNLSKHSPFRH